MKGLVEYIKESTNNYICYIIPVSKIYDDNVYDKVTNDGKKPVKVIEFYTDNKIDKDGDLVGQFLGYDDNPYKHEFGKGDLYLGGTLAIEKENIDKIRPESIEVDKEKYDSLVKHHNGNDTVFYK